MYWNNTRRHFPYEINLHGHLHDNHKCHSISFVYITAGVFDILVTFLSRGFGVRESVLVLQAVSTELPSVDRQKWSNGGTITEGKTCPDVTQFHNKSHMI
jgi:hypothetical protein